MSLGVSAASVQEHGLDGVEEAPEVRPALVYTSDLETASWRGTYSHGWFWVQGGSVLEEFAHPVCCAFSFARSALVQRRSFQEQVELLGATRDVGREDTTATGAGKAVLCEVSSCAQPSQVQAGNKGAVDRVLPFVRTQHEHRGSCSCLATTLHNGMPSVLFEAQGVSLFDGLEDFVREGAFAEKAEPRGLANVETPHTATKQAHGADLAATPLATNAPLPRSVVG